MNWWAKTYRFANFSVGGSNIRGFGQLTSDKPPRTFGPYSRRLFYLVGPVTPHQTDMRGIQNPLSEMCLRKDKTDNGEVADVLRNENSNRHTDACRASACSCISPLAIR